MISHLDCLKIFFCLLQVKCAADYIDMTSKEHFAEYERFVRIRQIVRYHLELAEQKEADIQAKFGVTVPADLDRVWAPKWQLMRSVAIKFYMVFTFSSLSPRHRLLMS